MVGHQGHDPPAQGTRWGDDATDTSGNQRLDQGVDASGAVRALPGEQLRALLQLPENLMALELPWDRGSDDLRQELRLLTWVELDDSCADLLDGVVALVGDAVHAHGAPVAVAAGDVPTHAADSAGFGCAALALVA